QTYPRALDAHQLVEQSQAIESCFSDCKEFAAFDGRSARCGGAEHNTGAVWLQHAEGCAKGTAADRIEDQPKRAMGLRRGQLATHHNLLAGPFGHRRTVFIAP